MTGRTPPVVAWEYCRWEDRKVPVDHVCLGDARVPCERRSEDGQVCGECGGCRGAQAAWLAQQQEAAP